MPLNISGSDRPAWIGAPPSDAVPLRETDARTIGLAPLGVYAEFPIAEDPSRPLITIERTPRAEATWREAFRMIRDGESPNLSRDDLSALQMVALDTVHRLFDDQFGDDGWLRQAVDAKRKDLADTRLPKGLSRAVLADRTLGEKQADALVFLLRTFNAREGRDANLRHAIFEKLGRVGRRRDIAGILPHVRRGNDIDLHYGARAIRDITARCGSPQVRGGLQKHPVVGPLLEANDLSEDQHQLLVEMVLKHGVIDRIERHNGGAHFNPVYFVTFRETEPGPAGRRPIRGVFKPETTWPGKVQAYFPREVSAYEFDRSFAKSSMVPPTVEGIIQLDGDKHCEVGSLQYMIPDSKPLGHRIREHGKERWEYDPDFEHLRDDPEFAKQMSRARTLLYVLGDPDKLPSNVKPLPNLGNFMVSAGDRLWMIDNAYSQGAAPKPDRHILPAEHDGTIVDSLNEALMRDGPEWIMKSLATFIEDYDAGEVSRRTKVATEELEHRRRT